MDRLPNTLTRQQRCRPLFGARSTVKKLTPCIIASGNIAGLLQKRKVQLIIKIPGVPHSFISSGQNYYPFGAGIIFFLILAHPVYKM